MLSETNVAGHAVKNVPPERLESWNDAVNQQQLKERAAFPLGIELTPERVQEVRDAQAATVAYARSYEIDISNRLLPRISSDYIRFLGPKDVDKDMPRQKRMYGKRAEHRGMTTDTGLIVIPEAPDEGSTLIAVGHEFGHHMSYQEYHAWTHDSERFTIGSWRRGTATKHTFSLLDEGTVVMMTGDIQHHYWKDYPSLAPYADTPSPGELARTRDKAGGVDIDSGIVFAALVTTMIERASQKTGVDVKASLLKKHFTNDVELLRLLSSAFGNEAVTVLARLDQFTATPKDELAFCDLIGTKQAFMDALGLKN